MKAPSVAIDDEDDNDHVTIELYHTVNLGNTAEEDHHLDSQSKGSVWSRAFEWLCCCCRSGQEFEALTAHGH